MPETIERLHLQVTGAVQGVGFRPFIYRLAQELKLGGFVRNGGNGVSVEVEGSPRALTAFRERVEREAPPHARIYAVEPRLLEPRGYHGFSIDESSHDACSSAMILPDLATCPDCLAEIFDPKARRFWYPFANCTRCGPRYTIIASTPYDRERTSMSGFPLCSDCRAEYGDPSDRRFHAQPIACPACGPELFLHNAGGALLSRGAQATKVKEMVRRAVLCLKEGGIVAVMGLGGAQLMADAAREGAVLRLRRRKARDAKPFAVMLPDTASLRTLAEAGPEELAVLRSAAAPIVLLQKKDPLPLAPSIAACSPCLGVMLPSTPLHHLLMREMGSPVVCTSGNLSGEPLCTAPRETLERLHGIADLFLLHNRPILRPVDDSVVQVFQRREMVLRRARGYAPLPSRVQNAPDALAMGSDLKNAPAWRAGNRVFPSEHLGDMETEAALRSLRRQIAEYPDLIGARPAAVIVDAHPGYASSREGRQFASDNGLPVVEVQHHVAHVMGCIAENEVKLPAMGVAWDGTGYGDDGTVWGGEFFVVDSRSIRRAGHIRPFRLVGGDAAAREPARCALGLLSACGKGGKIKLQAIVEQAWPAATLANLQQLLDSDTNSPAATSMGRLFDATAFFLGFRGPQQCEAQASMFLEHMARRYRPAKKTPLPLSCKLDIQAENFIADWEPVLDALDASLASGAPREELAWRFHDGLAEMAVNAAKLCGQNRLAVGGGCFVNRLLLERLLLHGRDNGISVYFPQRIPCHDGGLAAGQLEAARLSFTFSRSTPS